MYSDRVEETTTTQGTGDLALGGAPTGRRTFIAGIGSGNLAYAVCTDGAANWELFEGTVLAGSPPTISRPTILASTNGGAAVNWGAGIKTVQCVPISESFGPIGNRHRYGTTGGSGLTYTLSVQPPPRALINGLMVWCKGNHSSIDGGSTFNLNGLGAKPIRTGDGTTPIYNNDISTNEVVGLIYDQGSDTFRLISAPGLNERTMIQSVDSTTAANPIYEAYRNAPIVVNMQAGKFRTSANQTNGTKITTAEIFANVGTATLGAESIGWQFYTMQGGALAFRMGLGVGLVVGAPTGGDKGQGTINAVSVYDDNVLLTCYPLAIAARGGTSLEFWNEAAHGGTHKAARRFLRKCKDWLDPAGYAAYWKQRGHLPAMPSPKEWQQRGKTISVGELVQRLWETADNQAVLIDKLRTRIEALEKQ